MAAIMRNIDRMWEIWGQHIRITTKQTRERAQCGANAARRQLGTSDCNSTLRRMRVPPGAAVISIREPADPRTAPHQPPPVTNPHAQQQQELIGATEHTPVTIAADQCTTMPVAGAYKMRTALK